MSQYRFLRLRLWRIIVESPADISSSSALVSASTLSRTRYRLRVAFTARPYRFKSSVLLWSFTTSTERCSGKLTIICPILARPFVICFAIRYIIEEVLLLTERRLGVLDWLEHVLIEGFPLVQLRLFTLRTHGAQGHHVTVRLLLTSTVVVVWLLHLFVSFFSGNVQLLDKLLR